MTNKVRVWDLPTRVFHWGLVLCIVGLVTTGLVGGAAMVWHFRLGYAVLSLLLFRLVWGFVGGHWSRFGVFVAGPAAILRYLRGQGGYNAVGHNPLGALSVLAMLGLLLLQVASGLISDDEIATAGPLAKFASGFWVGKATHYHTAIGQYVVYGLVTLHMAALAFYHFKRNNPLVPAMWHGDKEVLTPEVQARDDTRARLLALVVFGFCAAAVTGLVQWAG